MRNSKIKKKSMKKCVVDIRYHAAVGDYSRILGLRAMGAL